LDYDDIESILKALKDTENPIKPVKGFYFGSQDMDEWYKEDVKNAIEVFESVLKDMDNGFGKRYLDFYYQASW